MLGTNIVILGKNTYVFGKSEQIQFYNRYLGYCTIGDKDCHIVPRYSHILTLMSIEVILGETQSYRTQ